MQRHKNDDEVQLHLENVFSCKCIDKKSFVAIFKTLLSGKVHALAFSTELDKRKCWRLSGIKSAAVY